MWTTNLRPDDAVRRNVQTSQDEVGGGSAVALIHVES